MKNTFFLFLFLISYTVSAQKTTIICGEIENYFDDSIYFYFEPLGEYTFNNPPLSAAKLKRISEKKASFRFEMPLETEYSGRWLYGKEGFFIDASWFSVNPEDSLVVSFDCKNFENTLSYAGKGAQRNNLRIEPKWIEENINLDKQLVFNMDSFTVSNNGAYLQKKNLLENYYRNKSLPQKDYDLINEGIYLKLIEKRLSYLFLRHRVTDYKKVIVPKIYLDTIFDSDPKLKKQLFEKIKTLDLKQIRRDEFFYRLYNDFLYENSDSIYQTENTQKLSKEDWYYEFYIKKDIFTTDFRAFVLYPRALDRMYESGGKDLELYTKFLTDYPNHLFAGRIKRKYEETYGAKDRSDSNFLKSGQMPAFQLKTFDNKLFDSKALAGKTVFIDVWATWCKPCLMWMPTIDSIVDKHKSNPNFVFLNISIDKKQAVWKSTVVKHQIKGINLWADAEFIKNYGIGSFGVPAYYLIDKKGNLQHIDNKKDLDYSIWKLLNR